MKKEQLVKRLVNRVNEAPIGYEGPERMAPDIQSKFEKGETPHSGSKAFPEITPEGPDKPSNFEQLIASQRFKEVKKIYWSSRCYITEFNDDTSNDGDECYARNRSN